MTRLLALGLMLLVSLASAQPSGLPSGQPSAKPVFTIDPGVHAGNAYRLATTPDERHLVSVGLDKTIRVWDVDSGRQVRRLILPVAGRHDGLLYALSLSPDGRLAAVGGSLYSFGKGRSVAIVSLQDGRIVGAFPGFESPITALAWSSDGRLLAIGFVDDSGGTESGLRILEVDGGRRVFEDRSLTGNISALAFRADGTLFATSHNYPAASRVVLYKPAGTGFNRVAERVLTDRGAFRAYWTADERAVLVFGHGLYDGESLAALPYRLNRSAMPTGVRSLIVRESPDGRHIFGAAHARDSASGLIRRWNGTGYQRQGFDDLRVPDRRIADVVALRSGVLAYLSEDGALAAVGPDMQILWRNARAVAELDGHPEALLVSSDEQRVALPVLAEQKGRLLAFTLDNPGFAAVDAAREAWQAPLTSRSGMNVLAWQGTSEGTVNGQPLPKTNRRERSLSVAVHSSEAALVYGSSQRFLRKVSDQGGELWKRYLQADVVAVNLLEKRALVVAATLDGFIHLLRWRDGEPLMSYYLQPGDRKWLAISRAGYYEAAIGAEDHAGWIVSSDPGRTADFFPLSRFRATYLLPGMVRQVLSAGDQRQGIGAAKRERGNVRTLESASTAKPAGDAPAPSAARQTANGKSGTGRPASPDDGQGQEISAPAVDRLPPVVDIVRPGYEASVSKSPLTLAYRLRTPAGAPVIRVRLRVNGQEAPLGAEAWVAQPAGEATRELTVELPAEDAELQLIAENAHGASVPAVVRVRYLGEKKVAAAENDLYVLAVGVSAYDKPEYRLDLAAKDAADFATLMRRQEGTMYRKVVVRTLVDGAASKQAVEAALAWLRGAVRPHDTAMVFLAGHGVNDGRGEYLYLPRDADASRLDATGVSFSLIRRTLTSLPGRTLMFVDTCHAGNVIGTARQRLDNTEAINELASAENNIVVFASSAGTQESMEDPAWGNGAFTKALLEGLRGAADLKKRGRITYKQLDAYVSDRVDELTRGLQTPVTPVLQGLPDFIIVLLAQWRQP
ncbi:caspase family protein [Accumulibacter sp.]|uniref:caspase family protein n=1 Tax=Accumulibacter sp. TaxID=2053492 RepID=UPI00262C37B9|nr:caspase family protein [Accumulibacter sp.]